MSKKPRSVFFSVGWNLLLLIVGSFVLATGIKAIAIPHGFITGGTFNVIGKGFSRRKLY